MKRKFFECALLLGVVMSVMFLAQTQDGIGHNEIDPKTEEPHEPPGHTHRPSIRVDTVTGDPVMQGGVDPRGKHFSGTCGNTEDGYQTAWGFKYGGGKYSTSPSGPDCDTQNVWYVRVNVETSTGQLHASITAEPEIYLEHFHKDEGFWQGTGGGTVKFSGVCFHRGILCIPASRDEVEWTETGYLDLKVKMAKISKEKTKKHGVGFQGRGVSLTAESEHKYEISYDELRARGYVLKIKLKAGFFTNSDARLQDKMAEGSGELLDKGIESDTARAEYKYSDWITCYCGDSKSPLF